MPPETDRQFARYRDTRDPGALAAVFDETAPGLLLLAIHLTKDDVLAEDLVQLTFLKVIENAASYDPEQPFLPWASTILSNEVRRQWRREASRPRVISEEVDGFADSAPINPQQAASEAETVHAVVSAIEGLEPKYRPVVRLKVVHGMKPGAIAKVLDLKPGVARTRLSRGLSQLRSRLPATVAGALAITLGGRGMAQVRKVVLDRCRGGAPGHGATIDERAVRSRGRSPLAWRSASWRFGSLSIVLSALVTAGVWWALADSDHAPPVTAPDQASSASGASNLAPTVPRLHRQPADEPSGVARTAAESSSWALSGLVDSAGGPLAGARVAVVLLVGCDERALPVASTDTDGRYEVSLHDLQHLGDLGLLDASVEVCVTAPGHHPFSEVTLDVGPPTWCKDWRVELHHLLTRGPVLRARVLGPDHNPATGLTVGRLLSADAPLESEWLETDTRGREPGEGPDSSTLQLPVIGSPPYRLEVMGAQGSAFVVLPHLPADGDAGDVVLDPMARVLGRVVTTAGVPVPFANVRVRRIDATSATAAAADVRDRPEWRNGEVTAAEARNVRTDADGRFLAHGLRTGSYRVSLDYGDVERIELLCQTDGPPVELVADGQLLSVWTVDRDGVAIPGMALLYQSNSKGNGRSGRNAINDVPGRFDFLVRYGSSWTFRSGHWRAHAERLEHHAEAGVPRVELRMPVEPPPTSGSIELSVAAKDGTAVDEYQVELYHQDTDHYVETIPARSLRGMALPTGNYTMMIMPMHPVTDPSRAFAAVTHEVIVPESGVAIVTVTVPRRGVLDVLVARDDVPAKRRVLIERLVDARWQPFGVLLPRAGVADSQKPELSLRASQLPEAGTHTLRFVSARRVSAPHWVKIVAGQSTEVRVWFSPR